MKFSKLSKLCLHMHLLIFAIKWNKTIVTKRGRFILQISSVRVKLSHIKFLFRILQLNPK